MVNILILNTKVTGSYSRQITSGRKRGITQAKYKHLKIGQVYEEIYLINSGVRRAQILLLQ